MSPNFYSNSNTGLSRVGECSFLGWSHCSGEHGQFALALGGQFALALGGLLNSAKGGPEQCFFQYALWKLI
ncbi:hypothetical protein HNS38_11760 [Lentimicrobium sp. L6]|uniref:hypothetical protein n=1 Tax=Lentimicrobium sp. L6 TaxID=2735916 RepID=UPI001554D547|nr:hypothetical protein [Lentimicrobium sp. L6]NPD85442.1 hypothetical protein [Lentimicrobium sp. L6]